MVGGDVLPRSPRVILKAGEGAAVPVILGSNRDEARLFTNFLYIKGKPDAAAYETIVGNIIEGARAPVLRTYADVAAEGPGNAAAAVLTDAQFACPVISFAKLLNGRAAVFAYEFDDPKSPHLFPHFFWTGPLGSFHGAEIAYVTQTKGPLGDPAKFDERQQALADRMQDFWGSFARTGVPATRDGQRWPTFDGRHPLMLSPTKTEAVTDFAERHRCAFWNARGY